MTRRRAALLLLLPAVLAAACSSEDKPYLQVQGGGIVFNYRIAQLTYGLVVRQLRPLPDGSVIEASFDLPGSAEKYVTVTPARAGTLQYSFESKPLSGARKGDKLTIRLRLLKQEKGEEIMRLERSFTVDIDQSSLPQKPLVTGPGYEPAPQED